MTLSCEDIAAGVGALFTCAPVNGYIRIRTPFLYPDGDVVDLFLREHESVFILSDLGESLRWLRMQTAATKRSAKQSALLADITMTSRVEMSRGRLMVRGRQRDELAELVMRLGLAAVRVADIWYTLRNRSFESFADEVQEYLDEQRIRNERSVKVEGPSGRSWTVDFRTIHQMRTAMISVLSASNTTTAQNSTFATFSMWSDLEGFTKASDIRVISLIDDSSEVWRDFSFNMLERVSDTVVWSRQDTLLELLTT